MSIFSERFYAYEVHGILWKFCANNTVTKQPVSALGIIIFKFLVLYISSTTVVEQIKYRNKEA